MHIVCIHDPSLIYITQVEMSPMENDKGREIKGQAERWCVLYPNLFDHKNLANIITPISPLKT